MNIRKITCQYINMQYNVSKYSFIHFCYVKTELCEEPSQCNWTQLSKMFTHIQLCHICSAACARDFFFGLIDGRWAVAAAQHSAAQRKRRTLSAETKYDLRDTRETKEGQWLVFAPGLHLLYIFKIKAVRRQWEKSLHGSCELAALIRYKKIQRNFVGFVLHLLGSRVNTWLLYSSRSFFYFCIL